MFGETTEFGGSVPVAGIAGDQQAALYGQACHEAGLGKNTYGTGSFVLENAGGEPPEPAEGLLTTIAWGVDGRVDYALEAAIFVTGAAVQWLRDGLGVIKSAAETEELARSLDSNDGVYFVPALHRPRLAALGPVRARDDRRPDARHRAGPPGPRRARGDGLPDRRRGARDGGRRRGSCSSELQADGGAIVNAWLMQFQADVLGVPVVVPEITETTALGAAYLAGVATGAWTEADVRAMWREAARYEPPMGEDQREQALAGWERALAAGRQ